MTGRQLELPAGEELVNDVEILDGSAVVGEGCSETAAAVDAAAAESGLAQRNLFGEAERIAARAASTGTRRQYASIYRTFSDWLREQLGRPPVVRDLDADVIAAYGRHLATVGGRGGRPAAPATARVYLSMLRALARQLGRDDQAAEVRVPRHEPGPPETLTDTDYANLLRVPDRRSLAGQRDYALLRVLGDCGLRSAELRGLRAQDLRRPRVNAHHFRLFVRGKGGREREVPVPEAVQQAIDAWVKVHPLASGVGLRDEHPLFVRLGRHGHENPLALSAEAVYRLVRRHCLAAGVPDRLAHRMHCGPTGLPTALRLVCRCTRSQRVLGTSICALQLGMPPPGPSASTRSLRYWTAATRPAAGHGPADPRDGSLTSCWRSLMRPTRSSRAESPTSSAPR